MQSYYKPPIRAVKMPELWSNFTGRRTPQAWWIGLETVCPVSICQKERRPYPVGASSTGRVCLVEG